MKFPRIAAALLLVSVVSFPAFASDSRPIKPLGKDGKPLNFDFETGTLKDWVATGDAFDGQPIRGDTVSSRRGDMHSNHQGQFWIGGFEVHGDDATGTLTSVPFKAAHPWASFLMNGGTWAETRVELLTADDKKVFFKISGAESEELRPVVVDLEKQLGKEIVIRLVDERKGAWGHVNFDDFEFYDARPEFKNELKPAAELLVLQNDIYKYAGVTPEKAAEVMTLPEGFKAQLVAGEPDIVQPIAFTIDQRGRLWVVEGMTYPQRAPEGKGQDRILVFEDEKGEGHFTKRTVFTEGLNLVSGIEVGFGGVWVGAAPNLLFIPTDLNADEPKPAGPPQVLLDGFGYHDTHETLNTFSWGPDGWLYGCHGVFTQSNVGKPGTPAGQRVHINAGIFRYHPTRHIFERFCEGTSNPWGVDFDDHGQCIIEACVVPHLWHMIQGAHYQRQGGQHDNPYVYDDIKTIADHLHWASGIAANQWAANGKSDAMGGGHAHAGLMVYLGGSWPDEFTGRYFMNNIHGARINMDVPEAKGSGFIGHHGKDFILFNDLWSQIVNLRYDQDGSCYMIDWYDRNQCHSPDPKVHDRSNGRIFKVVYGDTKTTKVDLAKKSDAELAAMQTDKHEWLVRTARRVLQERASAGKIDPAATKTLVEILNSDPNESHRLRALWALHCIGGLSPEMLAAQLKSDRPYVMAWAIQFLCEKSDPPSEAVKEFARLANESPSPVVRLYLSSACQRMPLEERWDIVAGLLGHAEDANDHNLPLMDWYALEPLCAADAQRALALAANSRIPRVLAFAVHRIGSTGGKATDTLVAALGRMEDDARRLEILNGIRDSLQGRRSVPMPQGWTDIEPKLALSKSDAVKAQARALAVTFGSPEAIAATRKILADVTAPAAERQAALDSLVGIKAPGLATVLQGLLTDPHVRGGALRGLAVYDDPNTAKAILKSYASLNPAEKKDALSTLASRPATAKELLAAVGYGDPPVKDVSADIVRQLRTLNDKEIDKQVAQVWGVLRDSPADKKARIAQLKSLILSPGRPDLSHGRLLFTKTCQQCHSLYDPTGGHVGPDLTGSNRSDLDYILENVVDPNAIIPADYRTTQIETTDDRTILGIVKKEDDKSVTVVMPGQDLVVPKSEIKSRRLSPLSMMPEGLLDTFPNQDIRDLIGYLRAREQVPLAAEAAAPADSKADQPKTPEIKQATAEDAKNFFNGKDLSNWWGDMTLFTVKDGEIVGKTTTGIKQNEFLKSRLSVGDFRLVCKIKLVPNEANSGIQFRSVPHDGNEMAGPQADAGKGWWGKLYGENFGDKVIGENKSGEQVVKPNEWNTYEVLAVGTKVRTAINGHLCVDEDIPNLPKTGIFGLQVHAGGPTEVRFKDLELELDPKFELKTLQPSGGKAHALESGQTSIPYVKDFVHFFPGAIHDISYYTGVAGPPTWRSQVGLFGRYFLVMELGIKVDSAKGTIINWGEPKFILREIEAVAWDANTRTETVTPGTLNLEFGSQKWKIVTDHNGDLEALGISLKKGRPAPGFEEYWRGN